MPKPQALIEQVRSSVVVELERRHAPTLLADRKAAKAAKHRERFKIRKRGAVQSVCDGEHKSSESKSTGKIG